MAILCTHFCAQNINFDLKFRCCENGKRKLLTDGQRRDDCVKSRMRRFLSISTLSPL